MKKVVGYLVSVVGLILMVLGFDIFKFEVGLLEGVSGTYVAGFGILLILVGVFISLKATSYSSKKMDSGENEIPIYEGVGKKRRIVGYRKN